VVTLRTEIKSIEMNPIKSDGLILDIGGGGEGVIGKLNGRQVVAIDMNEKELEETQNDALKIVMDATDLRFLYESFDVCAAFFALMYIPKNQHLKVFEEVHRVLKNSGRFLIWDVKIRERHKKHKAFVVLLKVKLPSEEIETGYGVKWETEDIDHFKELAKKTKFRITKEWSEDEIFHLELSK
jgi:ubiquinone/menaquinone biosynthesis C-methylase UbiE